MAFLRVVMFQSESGLVEISGRECRTGLCARPLQLVYWPTTFDQHNDLGIKTSLYIPIDYMPLCIPEESSRQIYLFCWLRRVYCFLSRVEMPMGFVEALIVIRRLRGRWPWRQTLSNIRRYICSTKGYVAVSSSRRLD